MSDFEITAAVAGEQFHKSDMPYLNQQFVLPMKIMSSPMILIHHLLGWGGLILFVLLLSSVSATAQSSMFGSDLNVNGISYNWSSSSEDGSFHTDTYLNSSESSTLTIRGKIDYPSLGEVTGAYTGYYQSGSFYPLNYNHQNDPCSFICNGREYTSYSGTTTYMVDLDNSMVQPTSFSHTYEGPGGSFTAVGPNGPISGSEGGWVVDGTWYLNSSSSTSWPKPSGTNLSLFGTIYYKTSEWIGTSYNSSGTPTTSGRSSYESLDTGTFSENWEESGENPSTSGNDPHVGNWELVNGTIFDSGAQFSNRSEARFVKNSNTQVLWVNGNAVNWQSSTIDGVGGGITDNWASSDSSITVVTSGNARSFCSEGAAASVTVTIGGTTYSGSITLSQGFGAFTPVLDVQEADPNRTAPLFSGSILFVDGVPFEFQGGFEDSAGNRTDRYDHTTGNVVLTGSSSSSSQAAVTVSSTELLTGSFDSGTFNVPGCIILTLAPVVGPPAFWVDGLLYTRTIGTNSYATSGALTYSFELTGSDPTSLAIVGAHPSGAVSGTFDSQVSGVFDIFVNGIARVACPAESSGALIPGPGLSVLPANFPPAVKVETLCWDFLGVANNDEVPGESAAYYGYTQAASGTYWASNLWLLKIKLSPNTPSGHSHSVFLKDYTLSQSTVGSYDHASRLFHTNHSNLAKLLAPIQSLAPPSYSLWLLLPPLQSNLPPTYIVRGQPWWYAGTASNGVAIYRGFFDGQEMKLDEPDTDDAGNRPVTLVDSVYNGNTTATNGTLSSVRGSVRLRDGTIVFSGNEQGRQQSVTVVDDYRLHTIAMDLDIVGNNLSFGILNGDASLAGVTMQFQDESNVASLGFALGRPLADWTWYHANANAQNSAVPMMNLNAGNKLTLYVPASQTTPPHPGIVLDPSGTSSFNGPVSVMGVLRVNPAGDLGMGEFHRGKRPDGSVDDGS